MTYQDLFGDLMDGADIVSAYVERDAKDAPKDLAGWLQKTAKEASMPITKAQASEVAASLAVFVLAYAWADKAAANAGGEGEREHGDDCVRVVAKRTNQYRTVWTIFHPVQYKKIFTATSIVEAVRHIVVAREQVAAERAQA